MLEPLAIVGALWVVALVVFLVAQLGRDECAACSGQATTQGLSGEPLCAGCQAGQEAAWTAALRRGWLDA